MFAVRNTDSFIKIFSYFPTYFVDKWKSTYDNRKLKSTYFNQSRLASVYD
jgi:hypothetical protein